MLFVTDTVYVVFELGLTVMDCVVAPLLHKYVYPVPAFALNVVDAPLQIVVALAVIDAVGKLTTFTIT